MKADRLPAIVLVLFSLFICHQALTIGVGTFRDPGSGLLVVIAGLGLGGSGAILLVQSFLSRKEARAKAEGERARPRPALLLAIGSLFAYTLCVTRLGFVLSTFGLAFVLFRLTERRRWWVSAFTALLISLGNYLLFVVWLGLSLPKGLLPWW